MSSALKQLVKAFGEEVGKLRFRLPVSYVYNPLDYAWAGQEAFLDKFFPFDAHGEVERPTLLVSMNPGPHGMSQSGVAFGAPAIVREWMGIDLPHDAVRPPPVVCPSRPIFGFSPVPITPATNDEPTATAPECRSGNVKKSKKKRTPKRAQPSLRQEASGKRIYVDWAMNAYPSAEAFFKEFFIYSYCPLQFMAASGSNITPDELHREDRAKLYDVCNLYLRKMILLIRPSRVIAIGNFAHERLHSAFAKNDHHDLLEGLTVGKIPHPSPRSPQARVMWGNQGKQISELLRGYGVDVPCIGGSSNSSDGEVAVKEEEEVVGGEEDGEVRSPRQANKRAKTNTHPTAISKRRKRDRLQ